MMWAIISLVIFSLLKILVTSLPSGVVERLLGRFEVHAKVKNDHANITLDGQSLDDHEKSQVIRDFNEAIFIERYYIYPGDEERFLHPKEGPTPLVIQTKLGKEDITLYLFNYDDHVDVVRQFTHKPKKKVTAYRLRSEHLQTLQTVAHI
ncbi:YfmQ family protein [Bacillus sp. NPDC077027]|uniref:YfmQ family protein n=1 Tax=Bacillus sp. NPDC077027 TaxID=3390548 RepID=UPI003D093C52